MIPPIPAAKAMLVLSDAIACIWRQTLSLRRKASHKCAPHATIPDAPHPTIAARHQPVAAFSESTEIISRNREIGCNSAAAFQEISPGTFLTEALSPNEKRYVARSAAKKSGRTIRRWTFPWVLPLLAGVSIFSTVTFLKEMAEDPVSKPINKRGGQIQGKVDLSFRVTRHVLIVTLFTRTSQIFCVQITCSSFRPGWTSAPRSGLRPLMLPIGSSPSVATSPLDCWSEISMLAAGSPRFLRLISGAHT